MGVLGAVYGASERAIERAPSWRRNKKNGAIQRHICLLDWPGWRAGADREGRMNERELKEGKEEGEKARIQCEHLAANKLKKTVQEVPGDAISFEQEMEKRAEWASQVCVANKPISPFPVQTLLRHPVHSVVGAGSHTVLACRVHSGDQDCSITTHKVNFNNHWKQTSGNYSHTLPRRYLSKQPCFS